MKGLSAPLLSSVLDLASVSVKCISNHFASWVEGWLVSQQLSDLSNVSHAVGVKPSCLISASCHSFSLLV